MEAQKIIKEPICESLEAELKQIANKPVTTPMLNFVIDILKEMHAPGEPPSPALYGDELLEFMQHALTNTKLTAKTLMTTAIYVKRATVPPGRSIEGRYVFANMLILAYKHDNNMLVDLQTWAEALQLPLPMLQEGEMLALDCLNYKLETEITEYTSIIGHFR